TFAALHRKRRARWPKQNRVAQSPYGSRSNNRLQISDHVGEAPLPRHTRFRSLRAQQSICSTSEIPAEKDSSRRGNRRKSRASSQFPRVASNPQSEQRHDQSAPRCAAARCRPAQQSRKTTPETPTIAVAVKIRTATTDSSPRTPH